MNIIRLLCLSIVVHVSANAQGEERAYNQQNPQLRTEQSRPSPDYAMNSPHQNVPDYEEVAYNAGRDNSLYDRNEHLREWDYQENWHNNRNAYLEGQTPPDRRQANPQYQEYYQQQQSYQDPRYNYQGQVGYESNYQQYNHHNGDAPNYKPYQVYWGKNMVRPWDYGENWHDTQRTRRAYLRGNNRPYHYPDLPEYRFYPPENYYHSRNYYPSQEQQPTTP